MKSKKMFALTLSSVLALSILVSGCSSNNTRNTESSGSAPNVESSDSQSEQSSQSTLGTAAELGSLKSFTAKTLDGDTFTQENFKDKDITVLNFWSTTCGPCINEMPALAEFSKSLPDNVQVVTVCLDGTGMEEYVKELLGDFEGVTILSGDGDYKTVYKNLQYTPTTVLVDSEGNFVGDSIIGGQKDLSKTFLKAINNALDALGKEEISLAD